MRELKFRVWDETVKKFDHLDLNDLDYSDVIIRNALNNPLKQQYTGLKDKTDMEVYEGDIVTDNEQVLCIEFLQGCFMFSRGHMRIVHLPEYFIVIGNIFENAELLEAL
jgi:uncharacterized phage protein (TIGR01671 family)